MCRAGFMCLTMFKSDKTGRTKNHHTPMICGFHCIYIPSNLCGKYPYCDNILLRHTSGNARVLSWLNLKDCEFRSRVMAS